MNIGKVLAILLIRGSCILGAVAAEHTIKPSLEQARLNAFPIFNSIHSAIRQWGSSFNHNGLAMIPATVPKGNLLYHGTHSSDVNTTGLEWLAFEPEHSGLFSVSWRARQKRDSVVPEQAVLRGAVDLGEQSESSLSSKQPRVRGYLRTYQASRDLNLLYFDGMSAAKGCLGTVDTQDLVLRMINGTSPCHHYFEDILVHEMARVGELCEIITPLGYDGMVRMEVGFGIVYCDFDDGGLHLLSQMRRPFWDQMKAWYNFPRMAFHLARAASQHYDGMAEAGRLRLDFSRMVSAYFYPINTTNPEAAGRTRCQFHYLQQVEPHKSSFTPEDHLIYAAVSQVTGHICKTLFQARSRLQSAYHSEVHDKETTSSIVSQAAEISRESVQRLVSDLQWTRWERCSTCAADEFCLFPMFPVGSIEDAKMPRCLNESGVGLGLNLSSNYWQVDVQGGFTSLTEPF